MNTKFSKNIGFTSSKSVKVIWQIKPIHKTNKQKRIKRKDFLIFVCLVCLFIKTYKDIINIVEISNPTNEYKFSILGLTLYLISVAFKMLFLTIALSEPNLIA